MRRRLSGKLPALLLRTQAHERASAPLDPDAPEEEDIPKAIQVPHPIQDAMLLHEAAVIHSIHSQAVAVQNIRSLMPIDLYLKANNYNR